MTPFEIITRVEDAGTEREILDSKATVVIVTTPHVRIKSPSWEQRIVRAALEHPKSIVCPAVMPVGSSSFGNLAYGGRLDVLEVRAGGAVVLQPRWNLEVPEGGIVECAMGGAYAFHADWYRNVAHLSGMKGRGPMELVAISLRTRLAGGSCIALRDVVAEQAFGQEPAVDPKTVAYDKMRLAMTSLPIGIATVIPTLLAAHLGLTEAIGMIASDTTEIHRERERFEDLCGGSLVEAAMKAGLSFGPLQKLAER